MLTAALFAALLLCLLVLAAAWAIQQPEPPYPYPGRHRAPAHIGDPTWTS